MKDKTLGRVFIIHRSRYKVMVPSDTGHHTHKLVDQFNYTPAQEFGVLVYILTDLEHQGPPDIVLERIKKQLQGFTDKDSLLCTGDPSVIAIAAMSLLSQTTWESLRLLRWDAKYQQYKPYYIPRHLFGLFAG